MPDRGRNIFLSQINENLRGCRDHERIVSRSIPMKIPDQAAFKVILITSMIIAIAMLPFVAKAETGMKHSPPPFSEFDTNGDGFVSEDEFTATRAARMQAMAEAGRPMKGAATAPAFSDVDTDGDGKLTEAELTAAQQAHMKSMHESHKSQGMHAGKKHGKGMKMPAFADLDLDGDGCIGPEEFARHQAERHGKQHGQHEQ
jgi:hypothetical protein